MKLKNFFCLVIALLLCLSLASCGETCAHSNIGTDGICSDCGADCGTQNVPCNSHTDSNFDSVCDVCGVAIASGNGEVLLVENGIPKFQLVKANVTTADTISAINKLIEKLNERLSEDVKLVDDKAETTADVEILLGNISSRGSEYIIDYHYLGYNGYTVRAVGNKIIVLGGSNDALIDAIKHLEQNVFNIKKSVKPIENLTMTEEMSIEEIQDDYVTTSVTIDGVDIKNFKFAVDKSDSNFRKAALNAQDLLYRGLGVWLEIEDIALAKEEDNLMKMVP